MNFVGSVVGRKSIIADGRKGARTEGFGNPFEAQGRCQSASPPSSLAVSWESDFFSMEWGNQVCFCFLLTYIFFIFPFFFFLKKVEGTLWVFLFLAIPHGIRLIRKDPNAGKDWRQEKMTTEDEMIGWHLWLNGHECAQTPGDGEGLGSLVCCRPWGHKESDSTEQLNNSNAWHVES